MKYNHPTEIPVSEHILFDWIGDRIPVSSENVAGDSYPQTWADDDEIYVGTGDPNWMVLDGVNSRPYDKINESEEVYAAMTGQVVEKITGDPEHFELFRVNDMPGYRGMGGNGPKPAGMICVDGVLYYAVQNLLGGKKCANRPGSQHASDVTIICSKDYGKTWTPDLNQMLTQFVKEEYGSASATWTAGSWKTPEEQRTSYQGWEPMFPGHMYGGLSFVQYGKNNANAVDDYVYAVSGDQWDNGRCLRLGRVPNDKIMEKAAWEFASLGGDGSPTWHKDQTGSGPILEIDRHISAPEMVYIASMKKYILLTWGLHNNAYSPTGSELTILESDNPWGPFSLVHYEWVWYKRECCFYTPKIPLKWFDQNTLEGYILHSGSWGFALPDGGWQGLPYYIPQVRKFCFSITNDKGRDVLIKSINS